MTNTLDAAIAQLAALPPDEQDRVGRWLLHELADDEQWARTFETSQDLPSKLATEARADRSGGRVTDLDPDRRELARDSAPLGRYDDIAEPVRDAARKAYRLFRENPNHPSLQYKRIHDREPIYSVRVTVGYRAVGLLESDEITWLWIDSHADYDRLVKSL